jgi:D-sedoheptulose 7-phosphate isomerase
MYTDYLSRLNVELKNLDFKQVFQIEEVIQKVIDLDSKIFVCGNGGSAATAQHFVTDLSKEAYNSQNKPIKAYSLTTNSSILTAFANDYEYEQIFSKQIINLASEKDLLVTLSCSGSSSNLINAHIQAKKLGMITISLSGCNGGKIHDSKLANYEISLNTNHYGVIEDIHHIICHMIAFNFKKKGLNL